ncbi:MAG: 2-oxoacid:acceptor oxidoreductase family protein [Candidatus Omnitrophota bacterium]
MAQRAEGIERVKHFALNAMRHALCAMHYNMKIEILISGFGGQGVMSLGKILAKAAMKEGRHTTYFPSYGGEMRGGTAHCFVKVSDSAIASPFVEHPDIAVILNQPSLDRFKARLKKGSILILNSDLINDESGIEAVRKISLPLNKMALECGNKKTANIIALGVVIALDSDILREETAIEVLKEMFSHKDVLEQNLKAFSRGKNYEI